MLRVQNIYGNFSVLNQEDLPTCVWTPGLAFPSSNLWQIDNFNILKVIITDHGHTLCSGVSKTVPLVDRYTFNSRKVWN